MAKKALSEHTKEELIQMVCHLKECKKFGLMWEEKPEKVAKDCQEKLPVLKEVRNKSIDLDENQPTNIIIEGDNYHALSVLNYTHAGKIDIIYIDPPYNTGNQDFVYDDKIVDSEDCFRHSKWLSFMEKRLKLAKDLLSKKGVIFISIDDNEQAYLKVLCDEIFGSDNFINNFMWLHGKGKKDTWSRTLQQYVIAYASNKRNLPEWIEKAYTNYDFSNPDNDPKGKWFSGSLSFSENRSNPKHPNFYSITSPTGVVWTRQWQVSKAEMDVLIENGDISWGPAPDFNGVPRQKIRPSEIDIIPNNIIDGVGTTRSAGDELDNMLGRHCFDYPKPVGLMKKLLSYTNDTSIRVLDFFAGSGTTGQAVLELNQSDGGNRQFILCTNNENQIAEEVTYPRIKTVITGVRPDGSKYSDGISANVRYFKTDFVPKNKTNDKLRREIAPLCTDMIKIRENCFEQVLDNEQLKVFKNSRGLTALIFDDGDLTPHIQEIEKLETNSPVFLYVFSYNNDNRDYEIPTDTRHKYRSQPIPEGVLAVYRRIFQPKGN